MYHGCCYLMIGTEYLFQQIFRLAKRKTSTSTESILKARIRSTSQQTDSTSLDLMSTSVNQDVNHARK